VAETAAAEVLEATAVTVTAAAEAPESAAVVVTAAAEAPGAKAVTEVALVALVTVAIEGGSGQRTPRIWMRSFPY
jgi:hypothetical protein